MSNPLRSLIDTGTKLWLDSIDPDLVKHSRTVGATGATSNPIIIADLLKTGRFDQQMAALMKEGQSDSDVAWAMTDQLVSGAQEVFLAVYHDSKGNDGYVSFELDPLLEDQDGPAHEVRVKAYVDGAKKWAAGHENRMIKIPATPAGLDSLEGIVAAGIPVNVTLIFSERQYKIARENVWKGAQRLAKKDKFKSVYSIFVSRLDVYAENTYKDLSPAAAGQVGILNAKRIWNLNNQYWQAHNLPLQQEIVFASTGTKKPEDPPHKYVAAFAGSDIETNPPGTNAAVEASGMTFSKAIDQLPEAALVNEIDKLVDFDHLEKTLMEEGLKKFADPQKALIKLIGEKRASLS